MRFMIIIKSTPESEAGVITGPEVFEAMGKFNEALIEAGVLLAADGLHPSSKGARVKSEGGKLVVQDGPFAESKELIAGFWIIQVKSRDEALEWVKRIPFEDGEEIEVRQVFEAADFADIVPEEALAKEQAWRDAHEKPITS